MTFDHAVALSFLPELPRAGLTERLLADDPHLIAAAEAVLDTARQERTLASRRGVHVVPWNAPEFPPSLLVIPDCPPALWFRGSLACLEAPCVAIVGSRAASAVAIETAERLGRDLAARGITVVSGLARGVDSAAHRGALRSGKTAAILGSGVDRVYPAEHRDLADRVAAAGIVASEYPPPTPPLAFHFPMRNRLISGLSRGVVVIEASDRSGSLITAACALEQGRDVMAVPGNVLSGRNKGGHALLRDGATIVESADDIVRELALPGQPAAAGETPSTSACRATSRDPVLRRMEPGQAYDLDTLARASGLDSGQLLTRLLDLELGGLVRRAGGGRFLRQ
jgi:DNA processing protein